MKKQEEKFNEILTSLCEIIDRENFYKILFSRC